MLFQHACHIFPRISASSLNSTGENVKFITGWLEAQYFLHTCSSGRRPPGNCIHVSSDLSSAVTQRLEFGHEVCKGQKKVVRPAEEKYRHHGLINIYLEDVSVEKTCE